ncbi:MAG: S1 RNA-binding domain-containing protein, partial [Candidatus Omnitrophica bacterium]|nr:S1 RNA-binding domain-containing protein [Candidatus Omnitrophota bacterium]
LGASVEGTITKVAAFGVFVEIEKDLEGLVHVSELELDASQKMEEVYKLGDKVEAIVIKVDEVERKIGLSLKKKE